MKIWVIALFAFSSLQAQIPSAQNETNLFTPLSPEPDIGLPPGADTLTPAEAVPSQSTTKVPTVPNETPPPNLPRKPWPTPEANQNKSQSTPHAERPIPQPKGPQKNLPLYAPPGQPSRDTTLPVPSTPETQMRRMERQTYRPREDLPPPQQGYLIPLGRYQRPQMQTEHHDYLMSNPQPQVNPPEPKVYPTPGDYSTLPGL